MSAENHIQYCVIGGQGINAYLDPPLGLDLDLVVLMEHRVDATEELLHSLDSARSGCKRRKALLHIERIVDAYPNLWQQVPQDILERLEA